MDELIAFMRARLAEWEGLARQALPLQTGSRDEGQPMEHVSWRRSAGHPEFALRHVETLRKIVAEHAAGSDPCDVHNGSMETIPCDTLRLLAADFGTHPDYRPEWAPGS